MLRGEVSILLCFWSIFGGLFFSGRNGIYTLYNYLTIIISFPFFYPRYF